MKDLANLFVRFLGTASTLWCLLAFPAICTGEIYKYVDKDGVIHFTNIPTQTNAQRIPNLNYAPKPASALKDIQRFTSPRFFYPTRPFYPIKPFPSAPSSGNIAKPTLYDPYIQLTCQRYGMDVHLVKAVMKAESARPWKSTEASLRTMKRRPTFRGL